MSDAKRGDLVLIHKVLLAPDERAANIPDCTKDVPFEAWMKGFLQDESATLRETVTVRSLIGRELSGELVSVEPRYDHGFGEIPVPLIEASLEARDRLEGRNGVTG